MRPKSLLLLALALGCGLIASIGISQVMDRKSTDQAPTVEMETIYVALSDVNLNDPLTADLLKLEEWPMDKVPPDALHEEDELVGRRPRTKIYAGEPIREAKLLSADGSDSPTEQIAKGMRVVAVRVDAESGAAGLVKPGDRVDVQLFVSKNDRTGIPETKVQTILEDIRVFAVDQLFRRASEQDDEAAIARTISMLVTPAQSQTLNLATELGKVRLVLRHPDDDVAGDGRETTLDDIFHTSRSDREKERLGAGEENTGINGLLEKMKQNEPPKTELAEAPKVPVWRLLLIEGNQTREFEFQEEGRLPQALGGKAEADKPVETLPQTDPATTLEDLKDIDALKDVADNKQEE